MPGKVEVLLDGQMRSRLVVAMRGTRRGGGKSGMRESWEPPGSRERRALGE